jgi:hypothetical protein
LACSAAIIVAGIYTGFTSSFVDPSKQGKPEIQNGQFVLVSPGQIIHTISEQEYYLFRARILFEEELSRPWNLWSLDLLLFDRGFRKKIMLKQKARP